MVRDLIGEVVGLSPYEKRLLDMLKTGGVSSEKRMYKFAKRRVSFCSLCITTDIMRFSLDSTPYLISARRSHIAIMSRLQRQLKCWSRCIIFDALHARPSALI